MWEISDDSIITALDGYILSNVFLYILVDYNKPQLCLGLVSPFDAFESPRSLSIIVPKLWVVFLIW